MNSKYKIIRTRKELKELIGYCKQTGYASIDFETNAKEISSELFVPTIMGVSFQIGSGWIIPLAHFDSPFKDNWLEILTEFSREVLEDPNITKISWNAKFELTILLKYGLDVIGRFLDGMLGKYLLDENTLNGLKDVVGRYLPDFKGYEDGASPEFKRTDWDKKPLEELSQYCATDCDLTFRLMIFFERKLIQLGFYALFRNMLMMGTRVLAKSELRGMLIDMDYLDELEELYKERLIGLKKSMRTQTVVKFEKRRQRRLIKEMTEKVEKEINDLQKELDGDNLEDKKIKSLNKQIKSREDKIDRYITRDFVNKKEKELLEPINFESDKQMRELLFYSKKGYRYPIVKYVIDKKTKKNTTNPSIDKDALIELLKLDKDGFIKTFVEFNSISKLYSTYVIGFQKRITVDDCIHGRFLLHGTVTGRLSSREPNLQNIPRDTTAKEIKKMFIAPEGRAILQVDYSQAELRVLAAVAGEKTMIEWFNSGKDIHLASACKKKNWDYNERAEIMEDEDHDLFKETKIARKQAKTINFGIVYGQGANMLAGTLSDPEEDIYISKDEAQEFLDDFFRDFTMIKAHMDKQHRFVKTHGYVKNVFGRKRRLPNALLPMTSFNQKKLNWGKVAEAQRASVNAPIQGAASDYTLFSSIIIWENIKAGKLPESLQQVATVHDSLIYYIEPKDIHWVVPILAKICENPQTKRYFNFQIDDVKMKVDFEVGATWADLHGYKKDEDYVTMFN